MLCKNRSYVRKHNEYRKNGKTQLFENQADVIKPLINDIVDDKPN